MASRKTIHRAEYRDLIEALRNRREDLGLSQSDVARLLGWRQQAMSAIEAGARRLDVIEFIQLSKALDLSKEQAVALLPNLHLVSCDKG